MDRDRIAEVGIDRRGSLWVRPTTKHFPMVYREAMEVSWDSKEFRLITPSRPEWSYVRWFVQILAAAREGNIDLFIDEETRWQNIDPELRRSLSFNQNWIDAAEVVRLRAIEAQRSPADNLGRFLSDDEASGSE